MFFPYHDDNPIDRTPVVTIAVIIVNFLAAAPFGFYLSESENGLPSHRARVLWAEYGFVPQVFSNLPSGEPVRVPLYSDLEEQTRSTTDRTLTIQPSARHVALTLITCMFLHGGWYHLIGNMLLFWVFGNNIEDRLGHVLFLFFYLAGGVAATLCHWLTAGEDAVPMIGASGAVSVVMGAYFVTYPKAKIHVLLLFGCIPLLLRLPALVVLAFWFGMQLLYTYWEQQGFATGVALWAHIGGFALGALAMPILSAAVPKPKDGPTRPDRDPYDFKNPDPYDRIPPEPDQREIWWEEFREHGTRSPPSFEADARGITWDDPRK